MVHQNHHISLGCVGQILQDSQQMSIKDTAKPVTCNSSAKMIGTPS
jgi:hypothetical protein